MQKMLFCSDFDGFLVDSHKKFVVLLRGVFLFKIVPRCNCHCPKPFRRIPQFFHRSVDICRIIRFEQHVYDATQAEARGDWAGVARETATALDVGLLHPEAATLAGYALSRIGDFAASYNMYRKVTENRPYDIQLLNGMAIACQNLNRPNEAIHYYEQALALVHDLPDVQYNLAGLLSANGRLEEAVSAYRRVTALRPEDAQSHYALGLILERTGRRAEAIESFRSFMKYWTGDQQYLATAARRIEQLTRLGTD